MSCWVWGVWGFGLVWGLLECMTIYVIKIIIPNAPNAPNTTPVIPNFINEGFGDEDADGGGGGGGGVYAHESKVESKWSTPKYLFLFPIYINSVEFNLVSPLYPII